MFKNLKLDKLKEKTLEATNSEVIKNGIGSIKETTKHIRESEFVSSVGTKTNEIVNHDIVQKSMEKSSEVATVIKDTSENIIQSESVQKTIEKTSSLSDKIIEVSKETFENSRKKLTIVMTDSVSLEKLINIKTLPNDAKKHDFLFYCKRRMKKFDPYDLIAEESEKLGRDFEGIYGNHLPYGRTLAFNRNFHAEFDPIVFFPEPSKNLTDMIEYGLMINANCLVIKSEFNNSLGLFGQDIKKNSKENIIECIYFDRIIQIDNKDIYLEIQYYDFNEEAKVIKLSHKYKTYSFNQKLMNLLMFASQFEYEKTYEESSDFEAYKLLNKELNIQRSKSIDAINSISSGLQQSLSGNLSGKVHNIDYAYQEAINYKQGAGYYAEYINSELLNTPLQKVELVGKSNPGQAHGTGDNAADLKITNRITGNTQMVQLKYKSSASSLAQDVMHYDNPVMIPPDKYAETVKILKEKYNMSNAEINQKVKKGKITYEANLNMNASLTKKLGADALLNAKNAMTPAAATALCTGAVCLWQGKSIKEATTISLKTGGSSFLISMSIGSAATASGRIMGAILAPNKEITQKNMISQKCAASVGSVLTTTMIVASITPDLTRAINGKISHQQLAKTLLLTGVGLTATAAGGGLASIPAAMLATEVTSQMFDHYVKDDVVLNYQIYKEVFIDIVNKYMLSEQYVSMLIEQTFGLESFNEHLVTMQENFKHYRTAKYHFAYEHMEEVIQTIFKDNVQEVSKEDFQLLLSIVQ